MTALPPSRRVALALAALLAALTLFGTYGTNASWIDQEFANGDVGALDCTTASDFTTRASGRYFTGTIDGDELDNTAGITGIVVTNDGTSSTAVAGNPGAVSLGSDAYSAPLSASVINGAISAGGTVPLPLNWGVGTYNQYGMAHDNGISVGASGAVTNGGAIDADGVNQSTVPTTGELNVSDVPTAGGSIVGLGDVSMGIGAVAATAQLDGCALAWSGGLPTTAELQRDYLVSSLDTGFTSDALYQLFGPSGTVPDLTGALQNQVTTLFGTGSDTGTAESGIAGTALGSVSTTVSGVLGASSVPGVVELSAGTGSTSSTTVTMDLSSVSGLLGGSTSDGTVALDLASGGATADLGALAGGLNGRPPNTDVFTKAQIDDLVSRVDALLQARIDAIDAATQTALDAATVNVQVDDVVAASVLPGIIAPVNALNVHLGYTGTIAQFRAGTETVSGPTVTVLAGSGISNAILSPLTTSLETALVAPITGTVTPAVLSAVSAQAYAPLATGAADLASSAMTALDATQLSLGTALSTLGDLLSVTVNSQPDQSPYPAAPSPSPIAGEYFVSALRVKMLNTVGGTTAFEVYFATASAGPNLP
jgi:hypothetical protein